MPRKPPRTPMDLSLNGVVEMVSTKELWLDLGLIPTGQQYLIGLFLYTPIDAKCIVEVRPNEPGKNKGTKNDTDLVGKSSSRAGVSKFIDMYRRGRLVITTALSTGTEHWWIRFYSRKSTTTEILWRITYLELN